MKAARLLLSLVCSIAVIPAASSVAGASPGAPSIPASAAPSSPAAVSVRFVNVGPGVTVRVNHGKWIPLRRGQQVEVKAQGDSLTYTVARGNEWQYSAALDLRNVTHRTVELVPPGGHLRLINRSGEDRTISWGGSVLGILKRGESQLLGPLSTGVVALHATGRRSLDVFAKRIALAHGARVTLVLPPVPAGLVVPNPMTEVAHLMVDFHDYGDIGPGARVTVLGLAPGDHRVELVGRRTGKAWNYRNRVQTRGASAPESAVLRIHVHNDTGEPLQLPDALSGLHDGPIAVAATPVLVVERRTFRLQVTGARSGLKYIFDVHPGGGDTQHWRLERPQGELHLTNATGEIADLDVDGIAKLTLKPDQQLTVRKVPAGSLQLKVTTRGTQRTFEKGIDLPANGHVAWRVSAGRTSLIVDNRYREQITLVVDGAPRGEVRAGSIFRLDGIKPGPHTLIARTTWSKRTETATVLVHDGDRTRFVLTPPLATLRVTNTSQEPFDVVIRGLGAGVVKPGKSRVFSTESGRLTVRIHAIKLDQSADWSGVIAPGQHLTMPTPQQGGALLIVRNPTATAIEVHIDGRAPVVVASRATLRVPGLAPGKHLVRLRGPAFQQRQRVHVALGEPPLVVLPLAD